MIQNSWKELLQSIGAKNDLTTDFWEEIASFYNANSRHYHNLDHLSNMLFLAQSHKDAIQDYEVVLFTIFYHDIIYNPKRKDNEAKSALIAKDRLHHLKIPLPRIAKCMEYILATKSHQIEEDPDGFFVLDFDLAILGSPATEYQTYTDNIRKEFKMYPDVLYRAGRKKVLKHFLEKKTIFKTEILQDQFEAQARLNLKTELQS